MRQVWSMGMVVPVPVQQATGCNEPAMSIDQVKKAFLDLSLARIATQQHKLSMEMTTIRRMRP